MRKTTALLDPIPAAVLALVVLAATAQPPAPQRTDASRFREPDPIAFDDHAGFVSIFDGQTLKDWVGDPAIWRVENGVIVGESTREKPSGNSYISYHGIVAKDFDTFADAILKKMIIEIAMNVRPGMTRIGKR